MHSPDVRSAAPRRRPAWLLATAALTMGAPGLPAALEIEGHSIPDTVEVGGHRLSLNGAGVRQKLFFRIYVCALYLEQRSADPAAILAADRPWQVTMHFTRNVGHHQVLEAFTEAFEHDSPGRVRLLRDDLEKFHAVMEDLRKGQDLSITYLPGTGTTLHAPSGAVATVAGKAFADALLRTWLGDHPSDGALKAMLLGG